MPFDGSGNFNRVMNWVNDAVANIKIRADRHDQEDDNLAAGLSNTLTKDGQSSPTANIPLNGKRLVNVANPVNPQDAATKASSEAIRNFSSGMTLTGASTGTTPNFVSTAFLGFTEADMSIVARKADPLAVPPTLNRIAFNSQVDGKGTDLITIRDDGSVVGTQGSLFKITYVTTTPVPGGLFSFHKDTKFALVEVQAAGGSGGGNVGGTTGTCGSGGGGGGGSYCRKFFPVAALTVVNGVPTGTIAVGTGAVGDGNSGTNGGNSSWTDAVNTLTALGGGGGVSTGPAASLANGFGGAPGVASGSGDINLPGGAGSNSTSLGASMAGAGAARMSNSGNGGDSVFGQGGRGGIATASSATALVSAGSPGGGYGGGGGGGGAINTNGTGLGGNGAPGIVIVWEYR